MIKEAAGVSVGYAVKMRQVQEVNDDEDDDEDDDFRQRLRRRWEEYPTPVSVSFALSGSSVW